MPPIRGNFAGQLGVGQGPADRDSPPITHARRRGPGSCICWATSAGTRKIPLPIVDPTTTATALQRPNRRGSRSPQGSRWQ